MLMIGKQLTAEQRLHKAVVAIMAHNKYHSVSPVMMIGKKSVCDKTRTAKTNGRDEVYGRAFVDSLTDPELRFLILHEVYHKMYRHLVTWRPLYKQDARRANRACDYVINIKLADYDGKEGFIKMPKCGLIDAQYRDMDSAQVFALLDDEEGDEGGDDGGDGGDSMDDHDWDGAQDIPASERDQLERDIDQAMRQGALAAGKMGSGGNRDLNDLLTPQINWREVLREYVSATCTGNDYSTWRRPNRRYLNTGHYLPSGISESVGELVLAIDTSGSIDGRTLATFLTEVKSICDVVRPESVRLLYWDTEVCADEVYKQEDLDRLVTSTKPKGGGGTTVECVPAYMAQHGIKPQAVVVLTDGYLGGSWGQWSVPVLWCILDNARAMPDVGKVVHIKDMQ
jgi:predicted metal-dependent peptidase